MQNVFGNAGPGPQEGRSLACVYFGGNRALTTVPPSDSNSEDRPQCDALEGT